MIQVIVGPTGSGKTDLSLDLARRTGGVIVNCDSLQFFKDIPTLTAMPNNSEQSMAKHLLFGFLNYDESMNAVRWSETVSKIISENNRNVVIVGGTFLYLETLLMGISELPDVTDDIRSHVDKISSIDFNKIMDDLYDFDGRLKKILTPDKHKQLRRAYEVYLATGKSILDFYDKPRKQFLEKKDDVEIIKIDVNREFLRKKIEKRFRNMLQNGAVEEVQDLLRKTNNSVNYPIFNAIGAREITSMLSGAIDGNTMLDISINKTMQYAKRQITWLKNRLSKYGVPIEIVEMQKCHI